MANRNRDDFTEKTKLQLAKRAGWLCSDPSCRRPTVGATSDGDNEINVGIAAHICAAAPEGPRYDDTMTPVQRKSPNNGLWLCEIHAKAVDANDPQFTVELLREWKATAQKDSWQRVMYDDPTHDIAGRTYAPNELSARLRAATAADLDVFRRLANWSSDAIELTLQVEGLGDPVSASTLASVLATLDDLILVAPPGTGKTTTLFQIADALVAVQTASPIVVPLGAWSADGGSLIEAILKRPAFRGISEDELRTVAAKPGVIMLLDGWNELDGAARRRATVQIERLQLELPELGLLIATRRQALDVPVDGVRVELQPLSEEQQLGIARALRGDDGARILDRAWRTGGVQELVTIPLYLTVLLALPTGAPFPATKEEMLRRFVDAHEKDSQCAAALDAVMHGLHQRFLDDLATTALHTGNTTIADAIARRSVSETDNALVAEGQITEKPQPAVVLDALVSHHLLMRAGDPAGYSFQHQQFQEWFASRHVEHLILAALDDSNAHQNLKADILNWMPWEESILFACERLARGSDRHFEACAAAILMAFAVDPMLAAEMIYRSTDAVWLRVGSNIQALVGRWHTPGRVDRAVRFMIASGRHEFFDQVWPLITDDNDQVSLPALRAAKYFRASLLGNDAAGRISTLPLKLRKIILHEIAFHGGASGLDLSAAIGKDDPDPEVKAMVVDALAFRRADRHVIDVLSDADDSTFDLVVRNSLIDEVSDEQILQKLAAARARRKDAGISAYDELRALIYTRDNTDRSSEITELVAGIETEGDNRATIQLFFELRNRYPKAIADGILQRLRLRRDLFHGADDLLAAACFGLEDSTLLEIALAETGPRDARAGIAVSVLGPNSVGRVIDVLLETKAGIKDASGRYNKEAGDSYHNLLHRIAHASSASLIAAIQARSAGASNEAIADLAELIWRYPSGENDRGRPFDAAAVAAIAALAHDWSDRLLASGNASRLQLVSVAQLVNRSPTAMLLPALQRLLDEDIRQWRASRKQAIANHFRPGAATNEARWSCTPQYQNAFIAIRDPAVAILVSDYLQDPEFGQCAAIVLADQWRAVNDRSDNTRFRGGVDFSRVDERRAAQAAHPAATSAEAEVIFRVIEELIVDEASDDQKKHAVALGAVAARLPHGERGATIKKLLALASRGPRAALTQGLILSGEIVDIEIVRQGIEDVLEAATTQSWILHDGYPLKEWLRLLPFTNRPAETLAIVRALPAPQRAPLFLEEMLSAFGEAPSPEAEDVVFQLAAADPRLYDNHAWRTTALRRGSLSAAQRFLDLAANDAFDRRTPDRWHMTRQLGSLMGDHPELRAHAYELLKSGPKSPGFEQLARVVAEDPDTDGLLLLIKIELESKRSFVTWRTVENVITSHVPNENWSGAYDIVPVSAAALRKSLLAISADGQSANAAASCLSLIDGIRDAYGAPESDPRHPDLESGLTWPALGPVPQNQAA